MSQILEESDQSIRVLIVDDSAVIRGFLRRFLEDTDDIKVTGAAANGEIAVKEVEKNEYDVVVLDIEMPVMDGLTALPLILEKDPNIHVIMASTLTSKNAEVSLQALELGATDYLPKPSSTKDLMGTDSFKHDIVTKVRELAILTQKKRGTLTESSINKTTTSSAFSSTKEQKEVVLRPMPLAIFKPKAIVIGSSTGGPRALTEVLSSLRGLALNKPIFITQHMPEKFTAILAQNLEKNSGIPCHEAIDGEEVAAGTIYVAPGNHHMLIKNKNGKVMIELSQAPAENFCRPSVDPMIRSIISTYGGANILGVMLTGMGADGLNGYRDLVNAGGLLFGQDEETSVVWGMPGAVAKEGLCSKILPINDIADSLKPYL